MKSSILRLLGLSLMPAALALTSGCATVTMLWNPQQHQPCELRSLTVAPQTSDILVRYDANVSPAAWPRPREEPVQPRAYWLFAATNRAPDQAPALVEIATLSDGVPVPIAPLNLTQPITNRLDRAWLKPDLVLRMLGLKRNHAGYIQAGTNALGQPLYITNAPPVADMYMPLSGSPRRYVAIADSPPGPGYYATTLNNQFTLWRDGQIAGTYALPAYSTRARATWWRVALTPLGAVTDTLLYGLLYGLPLLASGYSN